MAPSAPTPAGPTPLRIPAREQRTRGQALDASRPRQPHPPCARPDVRRDPADFTGGFVGYFGYELKADCGGRRAHRAASPDALWLFPDRFAVIDHLSARAYVVALSDESPGTRRSALSWLDEAERAIRDLGPRGPGQAISDIHDDEARRLAEEWLVRDGRTYRADVRGAQRKLLEGESYEICLTNSVRLPRMAEPWPYYQSLRRHNPAPYAAYIAAPGVTVASSSPERFLKISRDRVVESKPIKGTDLLRSDLGRVCVPGTVQVPVLMLLKAVAPLRALLACRQAMDDRMDARATPVTS